MRAVRFRKHFQIQDISLGHIIMYLFRPHRKQRVSFSELVLQQTYKYSENMHGHLHQRAFTTAEICVIQA
jgi:hypothetical protein